MTYGEMFMKWLQRILIILLIVCISGLAITAISRSRAADREIDALIARCDYWAERGQR